MTSPSSPKFAEFRRYKIIVAKKEELINFRFKSNPINPTT